MGGDSDTVHLHPISSSTEFDFEEEWSSDQQFPQQCYESPVFLRDDLGANLDNWEVESLSGEFEFEDVPCWGSLDSTGSAANRRRTRNTYAELYRSYRELQHQTYMLTEAKSKIRSYTPGSLIEKAGGMTLEDYNVPETSTLLLIGPKGSGKSSLVNRISRVFESDMLASERAQVSRNGTYFLQEYTIPRRSSAFCLFDSRGLSDSSSENVKAIEHWMTKGVCHGEIVTRVSDYLVSKTIMKHKARQNDCSSSKRRMVNFVIFVVNGLSVLESIERDDDTSKAYTRVVTETFKNPLLSFKDDSPVIVVTHGDLLSVSDRVRVRLYLGKLLGIPPNKQTFDIPENGKLATELAIVQMLRYCLEHADRNLPCKHQFLKKIRKSFPSAYVLLFLVLGITFILGNTCSCLVNRIHAQRVSRHVQADQSFSLHKGLISRSVHAEHGTPPPSPFHANTSVPAHKQVEVDNPTNQEDDKDPTPFEVERGASPHSASADHAHRSDIRAEDRAPCDIQLECRAPADIKVERKSETNRARRGAPSRSKVNGAKGGDPLRRKGKQRPPSQVEVTGSDSSDVEVDWGSIRHLWLTDTH